MAIRLPVPPQSWGLSCLLRLFGMLRLDPKTVLILLTKTRACSTGPGPWLVRALSMTCAHVQSRPRSCAVTSTVTTKPFFPVLDIIETEDNKTLLPHIDRSRPSGTSLSLLAHNSNYAYWHIYVKEFGPKRGGWEPYSLHVQYTSNKSAWMNAKVFTDWFNHFNRQMNRIWRM